MTRGFYPPNLNTKSSAIPPTLTPFHIDTKCGSILQQLVLVSSLVSLCNLVCYYCYHCINRGESRHFRKGEGRSLPSFFLSLSPLPLLPSPLEVGLLKPARESVAQGGGGAGSAAVNSPLINVLYLNRNVGAPIVCMQPVSLCFVVSSLCDMIYCVLDYLLNCEHAAS